MYHLHNAARLSVSCLNYSTKLVVHPSAGWVVFGVRLLFLCSFELGLLP